MQVVLGHAAPEVLAELEKKHHVSKRVVVVKLGRPAHQSRELLLEDRHLVGFWNVLGDLKTFVLIEWSECVYYYVRM